MAATFSPGFVICKQLINDVNTELHDVRVCEGSGYKAGLSPPNSRTQPWYKCCTFLVLRRDYRMDGELITSPVDIDALLPGMYQLVE